MHTPPFKSWDPGIYESGWEMGVRHASTGDPQDFSDARCKPLEVERDNAAEKHGPWGTLAYAAFFGGYEDGYGSIFYGKD